MQAAKVHNFEDYDTSSEYMEQFDLIDKVIDDFMESNLYKTKVAPAAKFLYRESTEVRKAALETGDPAVISQLIIAESKKMDQQHEATMTILGMYRDGAGALFNLCKPTLKEKAAHFLKKFWVF